MSTKAATARPTTMSMMTSAALLAVLTAACTSGSVDEPPTSDRAGTSPSIASQEWQRGTVEEAGLDKAAVNTLVRDAKAAGSRCLVVVRDGRVVVDERWPGPDDAPGEVFSVTKSFTSVLIGVAEARGELSVEDRVATYVPQWRGTPSAGVTIEDILTGVSGRHWDAVTDYAQMAVRARDKTRFAIRLGQDSEPGTVWTYNNSAIQVLSAVLEEATGTPPADYAREQVLEPLGMTDSSLRTDPSGGALTFMGLQSTCLDVARLGQLMLDGGTWEGRTLLAPAYVDAAITPAGELNAGYGRLWWLNRKGTIMSPLPATTATGEQEVAPNRQMVPGAPANIFWALGFQDQVLAVIPGPEVVAVRLGPVPPADAPFGYEELTVGVLDALGR